MKKCVNKIKNKENARETPETTRRSEMSISYFRVVKRANEPVC